MMYSLTQQHHLWTNKHLLRFFAAAELCSSRIFLASGSDLHVSNHAHFGNDLTLLCMLGNYIPALVFCCLYAAHHRGYNFASSAAAVDHGASMPVHALTRALCMYKSWYC